MGAIVSAHKAPFLLISAYRAAIHQRKAPIHHHGPEALIGAFFSCGRAAWQSEQGLKFFHLVKFKTCETLSPEEEAQEEPKPATIPQQRGLVR
ncbi:hypothetical protein M3484_00810 [Pseudomonas sp. GX19020]|uniref:hypothetical protein n=1 Tax=Pseudomonas sp. GX19020 TaxID=2942277 RepID=UPI00201A17B1|nr:hypothetical protein [Pseudomonas sp. GX19020]MCL4065116.1 hypothetical protein [Pseudomonas sp. GX19020]